LYQKFSYHKNDQLKDMMIGRSDWKYATSKWCFTRSHTGILLSYMWTEAIYMWQAKQRALCANTHESADGWPSGLLDANARVTQDEGREANGWRKEDGEFVWGGLWR